MGLRADEQQGRHHQAGPVAVYFLTVSKSFQPSQREAPHSRKPEARAEGMRLLEQNTVSLSLRFGLPSMGFFAGQVLIVHCAEPHSGKPEARAEGMRFLEQNTVSLSLRFGLPSMGPAGRETNEPTSPTTKPPYIPSRAIASVTVFSPSGFLPAMSPPEPPFGQSAGSA